MGLLDDIEETFKTRDLYEVLEVQSSCNAKVLKKAYYKAAKRWHPDKVADDIKQQSTKRFQLLGKVHATLSDDKTRKVRTCLGVSRS